eukprot:59788-Prymnesium_polylepis.2
MHCKVRELQLAASHHVNCGSAVCGRVRCGDSDHLGQKPISNVQEAAFVCSAVFDRTVSKSDGRIEMMEKDSTLGGQRTVSKAAHDQRAAEINSRLHSTPPVCLLDALHILT